MADHESAKIDHKKNNHLLLDQSLLRLPHELLRKNFRLAHVVVERDKENIKKLIKDATVKGIQGNPVNEVLKSLEVAIARSKTLKARLDSSFVEETRLFRQAEARLSHLRELQNLLTVDDVKYDTWSRTRLDRLLVDYLLRQGCSKTALALTVEKKIEDLVDIETFMTMCKVQESLQRRKTVADALAWCVENKKELRKINSNLEFELRFQQYIEFVRQQTSEALVQAIAYARKWLHPYKQVHPHQVKQAAGLLAICPDQPGTRLYARLFSDRRWEMLAELFTRTHNELLSLSSIPLLHIALSCGLSALKTPACHSHSSSQGMNMDRNVEMVGPADGSASALARNISIAADSFANGRMCPICSAELNELARHVPYAHHSQSHVDHDLMLLPNGRVYGHQRLIDHAQKQGLYPTQVKDIRSSRIYNTCELMKVFIT